jgi:hypothetical protein
MRARAHSGKTGAFDVNDIAFALDDMGGGYNAGECECAVCLDAWCDNQCNVLADVAALIREIDTDGDSMIMLDGAL